MKMSPSAEANGIGPQQMVSSVNANGQVVVNGS
jgi:hypothetical protein